MDVKSIFGIVSVILTIIGYSYYFRDIFAGKTKPHAYSWLVWTALTAIAFFAQVSEGAGPGAWVTGTTAAISLLVFLLALRRGESDITRSDRMNLAGAGGAALVWAITTDPFFSILLVTIIDFFGFIPTIRKSYTKPHQETILHYAFAGLKFALGIVALENLTVVTWLYPASLVLANWLFIIMLLVRRRQLGLKPGDV